MTIVNHQIDHRFLRRGILRGSHADLEEPGANQIKGLKNFDRVSTTYISVSRMLAEGHDLPRIASMLGRSDVNHRAGWCTGDGHFHGPGGDMAKIKTEEHNRVSSGHLGGGQCFLIGQNLPDRVDVILGTRNEMSRRQCGAMPVAFRKSCAHRWQQCTEGFTRRRLETMCTGVERRDLKSRPPFMVIEIAVVPRVRMQARIKRFQGQTGHIAWNSYRRPRLSGRSPPGAIADDARLTNDCFKDHTATAHGVTRGCGHPPRRGPTKMTRRDGDDIATRY